MANGHRGCVHRHGSTVAFDRSHHTPGENERRQRQDHWQLYILGLLYSDRTAACRVVVLLCLAGEIWECEQGEIMGIASCSIIFLATNELDIPERETVLHVLDIRMGPRYYACNINEWNKKSTYHDRRFCIS